MPDSRFFHSRGPLTVRQIAQLTGAVAPDGANLDQAFTGLAPLSLATADDISFFADPRYAAELGDTQAGACLVGAKQAGLLPTHCLALTSREAQVAYAKLALELYPAREVEPEAPPVHPSAELEDGVRIAQGAVIGAGARIGRGSRIGPGAVIGPGVCIGRDCSIGPRAVIGFSLIGDRVKIFAGVVLGEPGFGVAGGVSGVFDIPQLGRVIVQDDVTIGAGACIDRGAFDDTVIGESTKIDNLVHIAHNVRIGRACLIAAQVGISGSSVVGDGVRFGGQAGIADHLKIGDGATLLARAGLLQDVPPGEAWGGTPAVPRRQWLRQKIWLAKAAAGKGKRGRGDT